MWKPKVLDHQETEREEESVPLEALKAAGSLVPLKDLSNVFLTVLCVSRLKEIEKPL